MVISVSSGMHSISAGLYSEHWQGPLGHFMVVVFVLMMPLALFTQFGYDALAKGVANFLHVAYHYHYPWPEALEQIITTFL